MQVLNAVSLPLSVLYPRCRFSATWWQRSKSFSTGCRMSGCSLVKGDGANWAKPFNSFSQALTSLVLKQGLLDVTQTGFSTSQFPGSGRRRTDTVMTIEPRPCDSTYCDAGSGGSRIATDQTMLGSRPGASTRAVNGGHSFLPPRGAWVVGIHIHGVPGNSPEPAGTSFGCC
jgi:hypothetical protein